MNIEDRHCVGYDVTKLLQVLNDLNKHRDYPERLEQLKQDIPVLCSAHELLGILIYSIERDPIVDLRPFATAAE